MSKIIRIGAVTIILLLVVWILMRPDSTITSGTAQIVFPKGSVVLVNLADTNEARTQGLSGHVPLEDEEGLLFLYSTQKRPSYWMKDMLFPIDIIWIRNETVIGFEQDAQPENPPITLYVPKEPINRVLEVRSGFVADHQVLIGDELDIRFSKE